MNVKEGEYLETNQQLNFPPPGCQLDHPPFDPVGIDPVHFDYSNQMGIPSSMDSPNFNMDYTQVLIGECSNLAFLKIELPKTIFN